MKTWLESEEFQLRRILLRKQSGPGQAQISGLPIKVLIFPFLMELTRTQELNWSYFEYQSFRFLEKFAYFFVNCEDAPVSCFFGQGGQLCGRLERDPRQSSQLTIEPPTYISLIYYILHPDDN